MQTGKRKCGMVMIGIAVVALLAGSAAVAADRVVVIPLGGAKSYIVPDDNSACDATKAGLMRFTDSVFQGCNGNVWITLTGFDASVPTVFSSGHEWMDRNLGASRVAISFNDTEAYGDLYQWGRFTDGHEKRGSSTNTALSSSDDPGHGDFITTSATPNDWRDPKNDNLWQSVSGINNPCPVGFRLPTNPEWEAVMASIAPPGILRLVVAGSRASNGLFAGVDTYGYYWSSSSGGVAGSSSFLYFNSGGGSSMNSGNRANGLSVRCLKD